MPDTNRLRELLLKHGSEIRPRYEFPWLDQQPLSMTNANKFFLGALIDYQIPANSAWKNAKRLTEDILGNPPKLWNHIMDSFSPEEWEAKWEEFRIHRFPAAHHRVYRIGFNIVTTYDGDCRRIWQGKEPDEVLIALNSMRCGQQISRMIVGALITYKHISGAADAKADRHVQRVLGSIFSEAPSPERATELARKIHPDNPWELDLALFHIGQEYCRPRAIVCTDCPVVTECRTAAH
jgi:hypothetical protein